MSESSQDGIVLPSSVNANDNDQGGHDDSLKNNLVNYDLPCMHVLNDDMPAGVNNNTIMH